MQIYQTIVFQQVIILQICLCGAEYEISETDEPQEVKVFVPARDVLMHQQTEAIRRIVHAKSLELEKPFDMNDSLLIAKCQEIAQRSNIKIEAQILGSDLNTTTNKNEETVQKITGANTLNKEKKNVTLATEQNVHNQVPIEASSENHLQTSTQDVKKIDNQVPSPEPQVADTLYGQTLYYIYPQYIPQPAEDQKAEPSTTTVSSTTNSQPLYTERLRFVLKMPYPKPEKLSSYPWEIDKFAYYPRHLQPDYINMPVPYTPTYHMIRRLIIPSKVPGSFIVETNS